MSIHKYYEITENGIKRLRQSCPKCGPAVFLGLHKSRMACGKCGYTEFKK